MKTLNRDEAKKNAEYLNKTLKYTGFGDLHEQKIFNSIIEGKNDFGIAHNETIDGKSVAVLLSFGLKDSEKSKYIQFQSFTMMIMDDITGVSRSQDFKVYGSQKLEILDEHNQKVSKYINNTLTKKEAFNALEGRAPLKTFTKKEQGKNEVLAYSAYYIIDLNNKIDETDNFKVVKLPDFGVDKKLDQLPIKDVELNNNRDKILQALNRGNFQKVIMIDGSENVERYIVADPVNKTIAVYDENKIRIDLVKNNEQSLDSDLDVKNNGNQLVKDSDNQKKNNSKKGNTISQESKSDSVQKNQQKKSQGGRKRKGKGVS